MNDFAVHHHPHHQVVAFKKREHMPASFEHPAALRPMVNPIAYVALAAALLILAGVGKWMVG